MERKRGSNISQDSTLIVTLKKFMNKNKSRFPSNSNNGARSIM